ncbi:MAG: hypothetical protein PSV35_09535 [bacterium]|nr:hypothetical protein [bacterium]
MVRNIYASSSGNSNKMSGTVHGGAVFKLPQANFRITAELAGLFNGSNRLKGQVWEGGVAEFNNFDYTYQVSSNALMVESRLIYDNYQFIPYVLAGLGTA